MSHTHKFNATVVGAGRCSCGAWGRWNRQEKTWTEVTYAPTIKGFENKLRRIRDPEIVAAEERQYVRDAEALRDEREQQREKALPTNLERAFAKRLRDGEDQ